jgi:hypothetical protein
MNNLIKTHRIKHYHSSRWWKHNCGFWRSYTSFTPSFSRRSQKASPFCSSVLKYTYKDSPNKCSSSLWLQKQHNNIFPHNNRNLPLRVGRPRLSRQLPPHKIIISSATILSRRSTQLQLKTQRPPCLARRELRLRQTM